LRTAGSATTHVQSFPGSRMRVTIDHRPLAGITPPMLLWWFRHIGDATTHASETISGYLAWHPSTTSTGSSPVRPRGRAR
jgi:hypothetical protein